MRKAPAKHANKSILIKYDAPFKLTQISYDLFRIKHVLFSISYFILKI